MKTYILLLRGINIGVYNRIKMPELRGVFAEIGMPSVETYIQSGNVIFNHENLDEEQLINDLQQVLESKMGWSVPVFVYDAAEWKQIVLSNPFAKTGEHDSAFFHVTLLEKPKKDVELLEHKDESFPVIGRAVYLYCPDGYRNAKINNTTIQKKLDMFATTRNWNTMNKLLALVEKLKE